MNWLNNVGAWLHRVGNMASVTQSILWLVAVFGGVATAVAVFLGDLNPVVLVAGGLAEMVLGAWLLLSARRTRRGTEQPIPPPALPPPLEVSRYVCESAEYTYRFEEDLLCQEQSQRIRIRPRKDDYCVFPIRYHWTGNGTDEIEVDADDEYTIIENKRRSENGLRRFFIFFPSLSSERTATFTVRQKLADVRREFRPLLAKRVSEPITGALILRVVYPLQSAPPQVWAKVMEPAAGPDPWVLVDRRAIDLERDGTTMVAEYTVHQPKFGYRYELTWTPWRAYPAPRPPNGAN